MTGLDKNFHETKCSLQPSAPKHKDADDMQELERVTHKSFATTMNMFKNSSLHRGSRNNSFDLASAARSNPIYRLSMLGTNTQNQRALIMKKPIDRLVDGFRSTQFSGFHQGLLTTTNIFLKQ